MSKDCRDEGKNFQNVVDIVAKLRKECPWDREQTNISIKNNLIEEAYELFEAIEKNDDQGMIEELGDLLLQVVFHSQIKKDEGKFDINDVLVNLADKLIRRHPHVYGNKKYSELEGEDHLKKWEKIKDQEKERSSIFDGIPERMPALLRSVKVQKKMAKVGFDWDDINEVWEKMEEELNELKSAKTHDEIKHEIGDLLLAVTNLSRKLGIDPEEALHESIDRSINRFKFIENKAKELNKDLKEMSLNDMEQFWQEAKSKGL
ncbi:nucleoside triphosphate pyrophosphohydrolase [Persephonella sp.]